MANRSNTPAHLRAGTALDLTHLGAIEIASAQLFPAGRVPGSEDTLPLVELEQGVVRGWLTVAEQNTTIAGFTLCEAHAPYLHLLEVSVHPSFGRQGIGRQLVQQVLDQAQHEGFAGVSLTTFRDLPFNGPFYASMGFVELPEESLYPRIAQILAEQRSDGMTQRIGMLRAF